MELLIDEMKVCLKPSQTRRISAACAAMGLKQSTLARIFIEQGLTNSGYPELPVANAVQK